MQISATFRTKCENFDFSKNCRLQIFKKKTVYIKKFREAYDLACLGVTESDWKIFGMEALENFEFDVAKKAFHRIRDSRALVLINEIEVKREKICQFCVL